MATRKQIKKELGKVIAELKEVIDGLKSMQVAVMYRKNAPAALALGMGHGLSIGRKILAEQAKAIAKVDKKLNALKA